ncbi:MAG: hypothetical protein WCR38_01230 [Bacteroidales bacterium]
MDEIKGVYMQIAVTNFAKSKENGLCLIDMPTGTGKTYQTRELIKKIIKGEQLNDVELVIYLTPLRKNIDDIYNELRKDFENDLELFDNSVLRIYSNYECVLDNLLNLENQIPITLKRKESYKQLKNKISVYKELESNDKLSKELLATTLKEIRTSYEPQFRHDLEAELHKEAKTKAEKIKKINHEYSWVKVLYPTCLTEGRKVLFMTMDKFLFGNDPIVTKPYRFLSYAKIKGSLIFIDEFDATKDVILNQEIEKCTDYKIDLAKLFSGIATSLKGTQVPEAIFGGSEDSKTSFEKMKKVMLDIEKQYNLDFVFKLESTENNDRYFLFDDYQIHTITAGDKENNICVKNDQKKNQNTILIGQKSDDGYFYRAIYGMKGALNYFIHCCAMMSRNYLNHHNENAVANHGDLMEIEQAVSTVIDYFNLDSELAKTISSLIVDDIALPAEARKRDVFSTDFYMNGFRYYDFNDDISHDVSTSIAMCYLNNTPEKFIISLASKARVVGLSATASIKSVTGNYNLEYIETKLKTAYYQISTEDKKRISEYVNKQLAENYKIDVQSILLNGENPEEIAESLFTSKGCVEKAGGIFAKTVDENSKTPNYDNVRLGKVLFSVRKFLENKDSRVLLVLTNKNIKTHEDEDSFSIPFVTNIIKGFCAELQTEEPKCHYLFGSDFDKEKEQYQEEVKKGNKVILFSSYPSVGTGQNLQYELNSDDEELKEQKDIDSIYIELPTNILIHQQGLKEEGNLNKYIYQMETLRANGEISPFSSMMNIKAAFKQYMNPIEKYVYFDKTPYQCGSTNNHIVKILVQAIGRICRTKGKADNHKVNIYVDNEIMQKVNFNFMKSRLMNPEFRKIVELSNVVPEHNLETITNLNKAMDCNLRVDKRIENILSNNKSQWNPDDMVQWNKIRDVVLKYPTISKQKLNELSLEDGLESIKDFYLFANEGRKIFCYTYNKDDAKRPIKFGSNIEKDKGDIIIDAKSSRLFDLLSSYSVRQHFEKCGYATTFEMNECIILPVVFQNIYKGAIGEQAGKAILESRGVELAEIDDPTKFEKFDFCLAKDKDVYIDFKNWSENDRENRDPYKLKSYNKLELVHGKKAFIINVLSSELNIHESDNVVEISSLFKYKNGKYYELGLSMHSIVKKIMEACRHGN